jgi:hypothetical protein
LEFKTIKVSENGERTVILHSGIVGNNPEKKKKKRKKKIPS